MENINFTPFFISLKLASATTAILFMAAFPVAYLLAYKKFSGKFILESVLTLPIIMPPTVLGFYLLILMSPHSSTGRFISKITGTGILFSFSGIVAASCVAAFPYMLLPLKNGLESIDRSFIEASYTLGKGKLETLVRIIVPNIRPYIISAPITTFAHTIGAFGVVLMIGGNIPGVTKVASIEIYELVEEMNYREAHIYSMILLAISLSVLTAVNFMNSGREKKTL